VVCQVCWVSSAPKHSYLVHLIDQETNRWGRCVVQSECTCDMQSWLTHLASVGSLVVHDEHDEKFTMTRPLLMDIDTESAAHLPLVDPVN
jgi:hypothetical protein